MSYLEKSREILAAAIGDVMGAIAPTPVTIQDLYRNFERPPENATAGADFAFPCFRFAKAFGKKPQDLATAIADGLRARQIPLVRDVQVASAFINIQLHSGPLASLVLPHILSGKMFKAFAQHPNNTARVMIEYSQPNTHKEFHVGHARNMCLGTSLVHLFRYCGYPTTAVNYMGDEGTHIAKCLWYIEDKGMTPPSTVNSERGRWLGKCYEAANKELGEATPERKREIEQKMSIILGEIEKKRGHNYELWKETRQWSIDCFKEIYTWSAAPFDKDFFESDVSEESQAIVDEYLAKGVFKVDDGAVGIDLAADKLGFMIVRKRDGNTLYATKDLALARRKFQEYAIDRNIYVVASEQSHHFKQVFKTLEHMGFEKAKNCFHLSYGLVMLPEGKMSSRNGTTVLFEGLRQQMWDALKQHLAKYASEWSAAEIDDTCHRLCDGAIKYGMLSSDPVGTIIFNIENWLSFEGNSGPYLMYSYARTQSILRKAFEHAATAGEGDFAALTHAAEHELVKLLSDFNVIVQSACEHYKPSTLATYLFYLCKAFNKFYAEVPILKAESDTLRAARLSLIRAFGTVLKEGLSLLGMRPPERM